MISMSLCVQKVKKYYTLCTKQKEYEFSSSYIERDQMEWMSRRSAIIDLRNNYATLFDMITKNLDKVTKPKGDNDGGNRITYM